MGLIPDTAQVAKNLVLYRSKMKLYIIVLRKEYELHYQRRFLLQQMVTKIETHNWTIYRERKRYSRTFHLYWNAFTKSLNSSPENFRKDKVDIKVQRR